MPVRQLPVKIFKARSTAKPQGRAKTKLTGEKNLLKGCDGVGRKRAIGLVLQLPGMDGKMEHMQGLHVPYHKVSDRRK